MPDTKLSALTQGALPEFFYGIEGNASRKYNAGGIINVKDFGATGNGSTNDAGAIQAALDAAFGPASAPHGQANKTSNRPVFLPAGTYRVLTPLRVTAVWGGKIFGAGMLNTIIDYQGGLAPVFEGWTPTFWCNGCNFTTFSDLQFKNASDPTTHVSVCLWFGPDGALGGSSAHGNTLINVQTLNGSYGVIHGSGPSAANSENTYINCTFDGHETVGFYVSGGNSLNMRLYGSTAANCGTGFRTNNNGTIPVIENPAFADNALDIQLVAGSNSAIIGARTESAAFVKLQSAVSVINCGQARPGGNVTGSTNGTTLSVSATGGTVIKKGLMITGTDGVNSLPTLYPNISRIVRQISGPAGGTGDYELSLAATPGNIAAATSFSLLPVFCETPGGSQVVLDSCVSAFNCAILGNSNSLISMRNNGFFDATTGEMAANLLTYYRGLFLEYDIAARNIFTVAKLPSPSSSFRGVRMFVTDSTVAASGNFAAIVAGGGANTVPIFCDGTNWRIG